MASGMIELVPHANGRAPKARPKGVTVQVNPDLIVGIGTTACSEIRVSRQQDIKEFGSVPPHKRYFGMDSTSQTDLGLEPLAPAEFINLAGGSRLLLTLLTWALTVPRIAQWLSKAVAGAAVGDGAGAMPGVARFLLELSLPTLSKRLGEILDAFRLANRGNLAAEANAHASLQRHRATLAPAGKINVTIVASTTGGTVGILHYVVVYLKERLKGLSIDANFTLVLTLPACGTENVDTLRMRELCFGRLSELVDFRSGRKLEWQVDEDVVFAGQGPFFNCILVMPEPSSGKLPAHNERVGRFLSLLHSPHLGTALRQNVVDMLAQFCEEGPHGQPKFLTRIGFSELFPAAFADPAGFAAVRLGLAATAPQIGTPASTAEDSLRTHGLEPDALPNYLPVLDPPAVAPTVNEGKYAALVEIERKKRQAAAKAAAADAAGRFLSAIERLKVDVFGTGTQANASETSPPRKGLLSLASIQRGPAAAADLAHELVRQAGILRTTIENRLGQSFPETANPTASLQERYEGVAKLAESSAREATLKSARDGVDRFIAATSTAAHRYETAAQAVASLHAQYVLQSRRYEPQHTQPHAVLDYKTLCRLIDTTIEGCTAEVRAALDAAAGRSGEAVPLQAAIQGIVQRQANAWSHLADLSEAIRVAGDDAETAIGNALAAAEPNARIVPWLDVARLCAQRLFATLPPDHPFLPVLSRGGREVTAVRPQSPTASVVLIAMDIGLEAAAFEAAREAMAAHVARARGEFPVFADKRFEPEHELVIPPEHRWYAHLALPLHWHLETEAVVQEGDGRWSYRDVPIGNSYAAAMAHLVAEDGRLPQLPDLEALNEEVRELIGFGPSAIKLLGSLQASLENQLQRLRAQQQNGKQAPDAKWLFALRQARGITRFLAARLSGAQRDVEVMLEARGSGRIFMRGDSGKEQGNGTGQI